MASNSKTKPAVKSPTIYDVAAKAGVSKSLVSLVVSGDVGVSEEKRRAVLQAITELRYRPSKFAQQLAGGRTKTIGVIITDYKNLSFIGFLRGLREVADDAGFQVIISDLHNSPNF
jgi:DNA-binding LacI/PurR family transcriptional regulator